MALADDVRQALQTADVRHNADFGFAQTGHRVLRRHAQIASGNEVEPRANAIAVHSGDIRLFRLIDSDKPGLHLFDFVVQLLAAFGGFGLKNVAHLHKEIFEVDAYREVVAPPGNDNGTHAIISLQVGDDFGQAIPKIPVHEVLFVRAIEPECGGALLGVVFDFEEIRHIMILKFSHPELVEGPPTSERPIDRGPSTPKTPLRMTIGAV